jgi:ankyrin repeat protein
MKNPFLAYASAHWHYHVSRYAKADEDIFSLLDVLLMPDSKAFLSWLAITCEDSHPGKVSPLHIAASKGLAEYATRLIRVGEDVNRVNPDRRTPLHCAAAEGHGEVAAILSSHGASKDPDDSLGFKPLHLAALSNRANIVKLLLEAGVDPFTPKAKEYPDGVAGIHLAQLARLLFSMLSNMDTWKPRVNSCHILMPKV